MIHIHDALPLCMHFWSSDDLFFFKINFFKKKKIFQEHYQGVNGLDPNQDRQNVGSVGPDLGPNCLPRFSADDKSHR